MNRCRNCGDPEHVTQQCTVDGPWYPAPGKTRSDYAEEDARISQLVAVDILHEHEMEHSHD
jgi:hypothetical protein